MTPVPLPVRTRRPARATWGRRRLVVGAVLVPGLLALLVQAGGGWTAAVTPAWLGLVVAVAVTGARFSAVSRARFSRARSKQSITRSLRTAGTSLWAHL